jgi:hypothetical protein
VVQGKAVGQVKQTAICGGDEADKLVEQVHAAAHLYMHACIHTCIHTSWWSRCTPLHADTARESFRRGANWPIAPCSSHPPSCERGLIARWRGAVWAPCCAPSEVQVPAGWRLVWAKRTHLI